MTVETGSDRVLATASALRSPSFAAYWTARSVSFLGSQVTYLALPLTAILVLKASPLEVGVLGMLQYVPFLLLGLPVGVWVDRVNLRALLVCCDLGRALAFAAIPVAAVLHVVNVPLLWAVAAVAGCLTVLFEIGAQAFLPRLVTTEQLVWSNSRIEVSRAVSRIVGPAASGALIQALTAPVAIAVDAVSFVVSAAAIAAARPRHVEREPAGRAEPLRARVAAAVRIVATQPVVRALTGVEAVSAICEGAIAAGFFLYITRDLGMTAGAVGLMVGAGSVASMTAALYVPAVVRRLGAGRSLLLGVAVIVPATWLMPLASGSLVALFVVFALAITVRESGKNVFNVTANSLYQQQIPAERLGSVTGVLQTLLTGGLVPVGFLAGGLAASAVGMRTTLVAVAALYVLAPLFLLAPAVRAFFTRPETAAGTPAATSEPAAAASR
ncbi:MAG: MFS transporter [Chloroflexi bacterium]|nr:MAG: MFS transporter [Chloroflexota bacterium]